MDRLVFETKLDKVYNGAVKPLNRYVSKHAIICFKCEKCGVKFFGKPSHMVGQEHQRHVCNMPYGDRYGERLAKVSGKHKAKKKESLSVDQLNKMIWNDYTYQQIAQELKVNPDIVKDYFEKEGLI